MSRDHRDLVIEALADENAALLESLASYRALAHYALQYLQIQTAQLAAANHTMQTLRHRQERRS